MSNEVKRWCEQNGLGDAVGCTLGEQGFESLDTLRLLTDDDIKESFQIPKILNLAQCLALKQALKSLAKSPSTNSMRGTDVGKTDSLVSNMDCILAQVSQPLANTSSKLVAKTSAGEASSDQAMSEPGTDVDKTDSSVSNMDYILAQTSQPLAKISSKLEGTTSAGEVSSDQEMTEPERTFRFLLVGKTGSGKSTTGNSILGEELFDGDVGFDSQTTGNQLKSKVVDGAMIEIMDCPGLFDTARSHEDIAMDIVRAVACMFPGPHAILYVIRLGRYTQEEFEVYKRLKAVFDESISRHMIVVFTGADDLEKNGKSLGDVLSHVPEQLAEVLTDCERRIVCFNNVAGDKSPYVRRLMQEVDRMLARNGGRHYECPRYAHVGEGMREEVARRLQQMEEEQLAKNKHVQELKSRTQQIQGEMLTERQRLEEMQTEHRRRLVEEDEKSSDAMEQLLAEMKQKDMNMEQQQMEIEKLKQKHQADKQRLEEELRRMEAAGQEEFERQQREFEDLMERLEEENANAEEEMSHQFQSQIREMERLKQRIAHSPKPPTFLQKLAGSVREFLVEFVSPVVSGLLALKGGLGAAFKK